MPDRRNFLKTFAAGTAAFALHPTIAFSRSTKDAAPYFGLHPLIELNPNAVFIFRTSVDVKTNSAAKKQAGLDFGSSVFLPMITPGIPVTTRVAIKPNIVMMPAADEAYMGIVTDVYFVEGVIESLKSLGVVGNQIYIREVNSPDQFGNSGYTAMALRTDADLRDLSLPVTELPPSEIQWVEVPDGKWFKRIPYLWPVNDPETFLLNIAKFKTHSMGMSLCAKNLQGSNASPYVVHCASYGQDMGLLPGDVQDGAQDQILADYNRHYAAGIPRWDRPGSSGGLWQETWANRCVDNNSVTHPGLHIIEGIYGREGAFTVGPGPDGGGVDHMSNIIIFGKNAYHVDIIGHWLGGHEPGNFGLFHIARERGLSNFLNPADIPLFEWNADGNAVQSELHDFTRTPLRTQYLRRDYNGQTEDDWHLVDESYSYPDKPSANVSVNAGWNLASIPLIPVDSRVSNLFPHATSPAYAFNAGYQALDRMNPGTGCWLKFPSAETVAIVGSTPSIRRIPVKEGWNIIGPFDTAVSSAAVTSSPAGIIASPFYGFAGAYVIASSLQSGKAYWVKASKSGELLVPADGGLGRIAQSVIDPKWIHIEVRDADGHAMTLHLTNDARLRPDAVLPPLPPAGIFDVRFRGDALVQKFGTSHEVVLTSAKYPVEVRVTNLNGAILHISDGLGLNLVSADLSEDKAVQITAPLTSLTIDEEGTRPTAYALYQNYPNPFNPETKIRFSIATRSHVSLVVFSAIGQQVRQLVSEELPAGTHEVQFHAHDLPSGAYFYRIKAGSFTETKRMALVR